jgi:hypothetical protein
MSEEAPTPNGVRQDFDAPRDHKQDRIDMTVLAIWSICGLGCMAFWWWVAATVLVPMWKWIEGLI